MTKDEKEITFNIDAKRFFFILTWSLLIVSALFGGMVIYQIVSGGIAGDYDIYKSHEYNTATAALLNGECENTPVAPECFYILDTRYMAENINIIQKQENIMDLLAKGLGFFFVLLMTFASLIINNMVVNNAKR